MPWHIAPNHSQCPKGKPFAVVKDTDGSVEGCHPTRIAAIQHMRALYANAPEAADARRAIEEIRVRYAVPAYLGGEIVFRGSEGRIVGAQGSYLLIEIGGERQQIQVHPHWDVEYLT